MRDYLNIEDEIRQLFKDSETFDKVIEGNEELPVQYDIVYAYESDRSLITRIYEGIVAFIKKIFRVIQKIIARIKAFFKSLFTNNEGEKVIKKAIKETEEVEEKASDELGNIKDKVREEANKIYENMDNLKNIDINKKIIDKVPSIKDYKAMAYLASLADHKRPSLGLVNEILLNINTMGYNILQILNMLLGTTRGLRDDDVREIVDIICKDDIEIDRNVKALTRLKLTIIELYEPLIDTVNSIASRQSIITQGTQLLIRAADDLKKRKLIPKDMEPVFFNMGPDYLEYFILKGGRSLDILKLLRERKKYVDNLSVPDVFNKGEDLSKYITKIIDEYADSINLCLFDMGKVTVPITDQEVVNFVKQLNDDVHDDFVMKVSSTLKVYNRIIELRKELNRAVVNVETYAIKELIDKLENCSIDRQGENIENVRVAIGKLIKNYELMVVSVLKLISKLSNNLLVTNNTILKNIAKMREMINELIIELTLYK